MTIFVPTQCVYNLEKEDQKRFGFVSNPIRSLSSSTKVPFNAQRQLSHSFITFLKKIRNTTLSSQAAEPVWPASYNMLMEPTGY